MFKLLKVTDKRASGDYLSADDAMGYVPMTARLSVLRRFLVEEIVLVIYYFDLLDVEYVDDAERAGFCSDFVKAKEVWEKG